MNTPSNAGKEPKCQPNCGHTKEEHEAFDAGLACGGYYDDDECPNPYSDPSLRLAWDSGYSVGKINRRTTPPTQSQEGETVDYSAPTPETDAFMSLIDDSEIDLGQVEAKLKQFESERNAAQRENDRLRSEVAGLAKYGSEFMRLHLAQGILMAEYKSASFLNAEDEHELAKRISEMSCQLQDAEYAFNAARAATEEGKRG